MSFVAAAKKKMIVVAAVVAAKYHPSRNCGGMTSV
jgi:hypothetical protein